MSDRRRSPRKKAGFDGLFKGGNHSLATVSVRDIGPGGMFIEISPPPEKGETVIVSLDKPAMGKEISFRGRVVRCMEDGMAIALIRTTDDSYLRGWVEMNGAPRP